MKHIQRQKKQLWLPKTQIHLDKGNNPKHQRKAGRPLDSATWSTISTPTTCWERRPCLIPDYQIFPITEKATACPKIQFLYFSLQIGLQFKIQIFCYLHSSQVLCRYCLDLVSSAFNLSPIVFHHFYIPEGKIGKEPHCWDFPSEIFLQDYTS